MVPASSALKDALDDQLLPNWSLPDRAKEAIWPTESPTTFIFTGSPTSTSCGVTSSFGCMDTPPILLLAHEEISMPGSKTPIKAVAIDLFKFHPFFGALSQKS